MKITGMTNAAAIAARFQFMPRTPVRVPATV